MSDLFITGGRLFDPASGLDAEGDVLVREDKIVAVGEVEPQGDERVVEAEGLWVFPGLTDLHVHLRGPGQERKETIQSGTQVAAIGGFTTVVAEPNTTPPRDTPERIWEVNELAKRHALVHVLQKGAITFAQAGQEVTNFRALKAAGAVAASDDGQSVWDDEAMKEAFFAAGEVGLPLTVHVDDPKLMARDIGYSEAFAWPIHFSHVSLAEEVELIAEARARGLQVTGEATPHHLTLTAEDAPAGDGNFIMNPPLRSRADREALRKGLAEGVITVIASDHAPHTETDKSGDNPASGVTGLETTLGVIWTELVHKGQLGPATAVRAMTVGPANVLQRTTPLLQVGSVADITIFDPYLEWIVDPSELRTWGRNTPYAGWRLEGKTSATIVAGRLVMLEGMLIDVVL